jgi:hypothetical protein
LVHSQHNTLQAAHAVGVLVTKLTTRTTCVALSVFLLLLLMQEVDHMGRPLGNKQQQQQVLRPFIPAGRNSSPDVALKGQTADLLAGLEATLSKDWPQSFIKVRS